MANLGVAGMDRLQRSMTTYVKSLSKHKEAEDKEKTLPLAYMGSTMVSHGDDFEPDSEFGQCLSSMWRAHLMQVTLLTTSRYGQGQ